MRRNLGVAMAAMALIISSCASGSGKSAESSKAPEAGNKTATMDPKGEHMVDASANCSPTGSTITLVAKDVKFNSDCIAAAAGKPFVINFDNQDAGVEHNIAIFAADNASDRSFVGELITGPKQVTYEVGALEARTYHFHCDVHPDMKGALVIK